jgi:hypothetical protein
LNDEQKRLIEKERQERDAHYEKFLERASHRQVRSELRRIANRGGHSRVTFKLNDAEFDDKKKPNTAGLDNAFAVILGAVLDNTKTVPWKGMRRDQVGPGKMESYIS